MVRLTLSAPLFGLLPESDRSVPSGRSVVLAASSWEEVVAEVCDRFPILAERTLDRSGMPARGFLVVVDDEVVPAGRAPSGVRAGGEVCLLAALAGG